MRRTAALLLLVLTPMLARAQSIQFISPQQCVWRAGDNPAWSAPDLDETRWQSYSTWKIDPSQPRYWVRCHADLSALRAAYRPALQVSLYAAYQLYVNGMPAGGSGNLRSGVFTMNTIHSYALPAAALHPATIALRVTSRLVDLLPANNLPPLQLAAGDDPALRDRRAGLLLAQTTPHLFSVACFSIIGVIGLVLFGLFLSERERREYLLLAVMSLSLAGIYLDYLLEAALVPFSCTFYAVGFAVSALALAVARPLFCFVLAQRRVPAAFWIFIAAGCTLYAGVAAGAFLPAAQAIRLNDFCRHHLATPCNLALMASSTAPFVAFWPFSRLSRRMRPLAALCLVLGVSVIVLFAVVSTAWSALPGVPDLASRWYSTVAEVEAFVMFCVLAALFALLFREHRQIAEDRAVLAGEMQAAREIQRMIAPAAVESAPGLHIEVAFRPMREVGGDFYQVIRRADDATLIVIGDVSGKGLRAAMTGTLAVGALRTLASEAAGPAALLTRLNHEMAKTQDEGFITCLCALLAPDGTLTLANAGHLAPYRNGEELTLPPALPLGLSADTEYSVTSLRLVPGDTLTFLSDGVVEATSAAGELFGFDRTRSLSTCSAEEIARAAQQYGQEDDITVLTVSFAAVPATA